MSIHNIHSVGAQCTTVDLHHLLSVGVTHSHTAQINLKPKASKPSFKKYVQQVLAAQDKVWYVFTKTHFVCREKHTHRSFSTKTKNAHMSPSFFQNTDEPLYTSSPQSQSIVSGVLDKAVHCTDYFSITCETLQMQILSLLFFL